jgi:hypothetical protein
LYDKVRRSTTLELTNMNRFFPALAIASVLACGLVGCAAPTSDEPSDSTDDDLTKTSNKALMDLLVAADAPSDIPAGNLGVGGRVARIQLTTAQGGIAKFISEGGNVSTLGGAELGNFFDLGGDWQKVSKALLAGGAKWDVTPGANGASSSVMLAKVSCHQVVAPNAKPTCTVTQITLTEADSLALMTVLKDADAPSNTPKGMLGVGSRIAKIELTTAQGGMAKFISQGGTVSTTDGTHLADIVTLSQPWSAVRDALLDAGGTWTTKDGAHGSSSSTMDATVECKQVVAPNAKPTCTVSFL